MRTTAAFALAAAALLAPGCAFCHRALPLDPSGMEYPLGLMKTHLEREIDRTRETVAGIPRAVAEDFRDSWRHLNEVPGGP